MQTFLSKSLAVLLMMVLAVAAAAQERQRGERGDRGGRGRGGFGGGFNGPGFGGGGAVGRLILVRIEPVQEELGLVEEQLAQINDLRDELRPERGPRGDRPDFRNMTEQERQEFMAERQREAAKRGELEKEKLAAILMEHQGKRLEEIYLQVRGVGALQDPAVAEAIGLTEDDQEKLRESTREAREGMQSEMRELFQSGDREQMREKFAEMRKKIDEAALAVLSAEQKQKFTAMQGEKFDLPPDALRGAFGGGRGGRGGREGRPNRPQRPDGAI